MAYTKYSLTPADNNAAPPNGAPEGMLPSAVNDTMRDMMSQIRDVGDGIRGGTYTMTAPVITGGSITGVALSGNTLTNPVITGGSINNTPIGASTANTGAFTTLSASSTVSGTGFSTYLASPPAIGGTAAAAISSTNLSYTGTLTGGTGVVNLGSGQFYKDASGNVGIGTSSPVANSFTVGGSKWGIFKGNIAGVATTTNEGVMLGWNASAGGGDANIVWGTYFTNAAPLTFSSTNGTTLTERMRIDSSGRVLVGLTSANTSGANLQVSQGITFPATQSASSDANTLDDYEEGTWTPTIAFGNNSVGVTYDAQFGYYTKIGNVVNYYFWVQWSNKGSSTGAFTIKGLPFTSRNSSRNYGACSLVPFAGVAAGQQILGWIGQNESQIAVGLNIIGTFSEVINTNINLNGYIGFSGSYIV